MTMLKDLEAAIQQLEAQKNELIARIQDAGWENDRPIGAIPEKRIPIIHDFDWETVRPEQRSLPSDAGHMYQQWYSASRVILAKNQPGRMSEFDDLYSQMYALLEKRYLEKHQQFALVDLIQAQFNILAAVPAHLRFSIYDIELTVYSVLMDDEMQAARHLLSRGFLRSAGALAGVILERHLKTILRKHTPPIKYPAKAGLSKLNDLCKGTAYDLVTWRKVQLLTDLRNLCDHDRSREPTKDEVRELVDGVSGILRTCSPGSSSP